MGELVGIGTTSKVYKVVPKRPGKSSAECQPLACKIIDKRGLTNEIDDDDVDPLLEQLCREVEILRRIHHENIVTFYDYTETKDKLFIITERLDGGELFEYILNNGPLNEEFACRMLYGVFSAVAYLHERGVVHRDIKAENLIFCKDGNGQDSLKLIDFGFSTVLRHQMTGSFMGTGGYIAPEIRQNKSYSNSVDSWSLGVLIYCTLSARLPFGISIDALPSSIDQCRGVFDLTFPAKHWAHVSAGCKDLVAQLLEIDPNKRLTARAALSHAWVSELHACTSRQNVPRLCSL
jgi:serine/threonine protein kinase